MLIAEVVDVVPVIVKYVLELVDVTTIDGVIFRLDSVLTDIVLVFVTNADDIDTLNASIVPTLDQSAYVYVAVF